MLIWKGKEHKKIILLGSAGSGKSWLSKQLAAVTDYPLTHLDNEFWKPGWVKTPKEDWVIRQKELMSGERWIIDGNYNSTLELRFEAADLIIFLDMKRIICIFSAWKRHGKKRSDLPDYLEEKKDKEFFYFLKWIWDFPKNGRNNIIELHNKYSDKEFIWLKSRKEVSKFLNQIVQRDSKLK